MKLHLRNVVPVDHLGMREATDVFIAEGRIAAVGTCPAGFVAERTIDATGLWVLPGLIDLSARLREPGFEYKATLESELNAALAGGITSLVCPPDTDPVLDEPGLVEMLKHRARMLDQAHVYPLGALTRGLQGEVLTEMAELSEAGCVAFSQADVPVMDTSVLLRAMQYAATFGYSVWLRAQELYLSRGGVAHSGALATRLGLAGVPVAAETVALHTIFELVRSTGCRVHLCRLSSARGLALVRQAKQEGLPVTCDVGIHHVHLTEVDIGYFDSQARFEPPLRSAADRSAIRQALIDGTIDAVCSDHTPLDEDAKQLPFGEAEAGATGLELLLSLSLKWVQEEGVAPAVALAKLTSGPAAVLGHGQPSVSVGAAADLCLVDPAAHWVVQPNALKSQGTNTPFAGYELPGSVRYTLIGGRVAFEAA